MADLGLQEQRVGDLVGEHRSFAQALSKNLRPLKVDLPVKVPSFMDAGEPACFFSSEEIAKSEALLKKALIVKCSYGRPLIIDLKAGLSQHLNLRGAFIVSILNPRHLLFRFEEEDNFIKVVVRKSNYVKGYLMRFFHWSANFVYDKDPSMMPIWVGLPGLPVSLYNESYLRSIASNLGQVLRIHDATLAWTQTDEALICVDVDIAQPLQERIWIGYGADGFWQKVTWRMLNPKISGLKQTPGDKYARGNQEQTPGLPRSDVRNRQVRVLAPNRGDPEARNPRSLRRRRARTPGVRKSTFGAGFEVAPEAEESRGVRCTCPSKMRTNARGTAEKARAVHVCTCAARPSTNKPREARRALFQIFSQKGGVGLAPRQLGGPPVRPLDWRPPPPVCPVSSTLAGSRPVSTLAPVLDARAREASAGEGTPAGMPPANPINRGAYPHLKRHAIRPNKAISAQKKEPFVSRSQARA
ncbi:hypothetical protein Taro_046025 [Colocasia esculenta]|uniref:DUF4283 domain-containing protein n=1 Tax=Colocasia esculenta TaxID=4460 RepID=A0A843X5K9_COLES|nr:hypothetical protein [Colocasia esculenta]